jgi:hemerythrin
MSLMWREQLSVGNVVIDNDHKHLIDIINRVEESLVAKNRTGLLAALESLSKYSQEHFVREEKIAKAAGYEQVPNLNESHTALLVQLDRLRKEINEMGLEWSSELFQNSQN